jgi:hypothetical protein
MDLPQPGEVQPARRFLDADAELSSSLQDPKMRCRAFLGDDHGTLRNRCMRWADEQLRRLPP